MTTKMKKSYFLTAALAASMSLCSCEDFLTEDVRGQENLDTYFKTADEVNSFVNGCYFNISNGGS